MTMFNNSFFRRILLWTTWLLIPAVWSAVSPDVVAQQGEWASRSEMPTPREKLAACAIEDQIHVVGGAAGENQPGLDTHERYSVQSDSWSMESALPTPRRRPTASVVNGLCYVIGGRPGYNQGALATVEVFDPETGQWASCADMPTARFAHSATVVDEVIYVIGGTPNGSTILDTVEAYNPATDSWETRAPMPTPRAVLATVAVTGQIYAIGGTNAPGAQQFATVERYDPGSDSWSAAPDMTAGRYGMASAVVGEKIYIFGGASGTMAVPLAQVFDPAAGSWFPLPDLQVARTRLAGAVIDQTLFAIGGAESAAPPHPGVSTVEALELENTGFQINAGLNDAWFFPTTSGQGFFITVFPDIRKMFLAWFTYEVNRPPGNVAAMLGEPGHRWLTAFGDYSGDSALLDIEVTSGGVFDSAEPAPTQINGGSIAVSFADCNMGLIEYDIPSVGRTGAIPIQRIAPDNISGCEARLGEP